MRLTFYKNSFKLLRQGHDAKELKFNEAARFSSVADSTAKNILNKLALKTLPIPSGGPLTPNGLELFKFQKEQGLPFILSRNRSYLAHEPGLGKSAQAIAAVSMKPGRTLIICPAFLRVNWAREITKWFIADFPTISIIKDVDSNFSADFVICSDAIIDRPGIRTTLLLERFRFVFIDEGHRFKTPGASRTTALFGGRTKKVVSPGLIYKSEHVAILSGTPMLNRPIELWPVLYAMAPETIDLMSYMDFGFRYCAPTRNYSGGWDFLGSAREDELRGRISPKFMQVIKKADVLPDLPKKVREIVVIDKDPRPKDVIAFDKELLKRFDRDRDKNIDLGRYAEIRHINGLAKVDWTAVFVADILREDAGESIILFAHHRDVVAALAAKLAAFRPMIINGGVPSETRTQFEDLFQTGKRRLFIGNIDSMNLGLTLTKATRVVFAEYAWTPALNEQAEDRANRIGSKWSVFCQYIVLRDSIDEDILTANIIKQERIRKVIA